MKYRLITIALLAALLGAAAYLIEGGHNPPPPSAAPQGNPDDKALNALKIPN